MIPAGGLLVALLSLLPAQPPTGVVASRGAGTMVIIPGGSYRPLYAGAGNPRVNVRRFFMDRRAVTRQQFLDFVSRHGEWGRHRVSRTLADTAYMTGWDGRSDRPATAISWFAAQAFCAEQGKRLPTVDEWEYVAIASERQRDASTDAAFRRRLLAMYAARDDARTGFVNVYGVHGMHGIGWEWTHDSVAGEGAHAAGTHHQSCASAALGAGDPSNYPAFLRSAVRASATARSTMSSLGFRCAGDIAL